MKVGKNEECICKAANDVNYSPPFTPWDPRSESQNKQFHQWPTSFVLVTAGVDFNQGLPRDIYLKALHLIFEERLGWPETVDSRPWYREYTNWEKCGRPCGELWTIRPRYTFLKITCISTASSTYIYLLLKNAFYLHLLKIQCMSDFGWIAPNRQDGQDISWKKYTHVGSTSFGPSLISQP